MTRTFTLVTECPIGADAMFDVSLSIDAHATSMSQFHERAIAGVTTGHIGLGQTVTWRARHFGVWFTMTWNDSALGNESISGRSAEAKLPIASWAHPRPLGNEPS